MKRLFTTTALIGLIAGCGDSADKPAADPKPAASTSTTTPAPLPSTTLAIAAPGPTASQTEEKPTEPAYEPPFPDREDLFRPPASQPASRPKSNEDDSHGVVLKGFIDVDEIDPAEAVVTIDGQMFSLKPGEEQSGVQVISVDPPRATLQRGRTRWTANLYPTK